MTVFNSLINRNTLVSRLRGNDSICYSHGICCSESTSHLYPVIPKCLEPVSHLMREESNSFERTSTFKSTEIISGQLRPGRRGRPSHGGERKTPHNRADGLAPVGSILSLEIRGDSIVVR